MKDWQQVARYVSTSFPVFPPSYLLFFLSFLFPHFLPWKRNRCKQHAIRLFRQSHGSECDVLLFLCIAINSRYRSSLFNFCWIFCLRRVCANFVRLWLKYIFPFILREKWSDRCIMIGNFMKTIWQFCCEFSFILATMNFVWSIKLLIVNVSSNLFWENIIWCTCYRKDLTRRRRNKSSIRNFSL